MDLTMSRKAIIMDKFYHNPEAYQIDEKSRRELGMSKEEAEVRNYIQRSVCRQHQLYTEVYQQGLVFDGAPITTIPFNERLIDLVYSHPNQSLPDESEIHDVLGHLNNQINFIQQHSIGDPVVGQRTQGLMPDNVFGVVLKKGEQIPRFWAPSSTYTWFYVACSNPYVDPHILFKDSAIKIPLRNRGIVVFNSWMPWYSEEKTTESETILIGGTFTDISHNYQLINHPKAKEMFWPHNTVLPENMFKNLQ